jgi:hypothetical protein
LTLTGGRAWWRRGPRLKPRGRDEFSTQADGEGRLSGPLRTVGNREGRHRVERPAAGEAVPVDTPLRDIKAWQGDTRSDLGRALGRSPESPRGTLADDATAYLTQVKTLASYKSRVCGVNAWTALYGRLRRSQITSEHVRKARGTWLEQKYTTKTVNNRVQTLRHMYRVLDGSKAPTPADDVAPLPVAPSVKILVPAKTFRTVAANLTDAKTRRGSWSSLPLASDLRS